MKAFFKCLFTFLVVLFAVQGMCHADWKDALKAAGSKIQQATKSAIDWGAEKFKPTFRSIQKVSEDGAQRNYDRVMKAREDPRGFIKETVVNEVAGDVKAVKQAAGQLRDGDVRGAANTACKAVNPPVPLVGQAISPYTEAICDKVTGTGQTGPSAEDAAAFRAEQDRLTAIFEAKCKKLRDDYMANYHDGLSRQDQAIRDRNHDQLRIDTEREVEKFQREIAALMEKYKIE